MACIIQRSNLTDKEALQIKELLTLKPEISYMAKMNYGIKMNPVPFYFKDGENVHLPMFFTRVLKGKFINDSNEYKPINVNFIHQLYEHQTPVAEQALEHLSTHRGTIVGVYPGFGKTVIGAYLTSKLKVLSCVICHRDILQSQWEKTFHDFTDVPHDKIWIVGVNKVIPEKAEVIIVMDTRVEKIPTDIIKRVGLLIMDEAHCLCTTSRVKPLLSFTPRYAVAMSATLERDDKMESMMYSICGKKVINKTSSKPFIVYKTMTNVAPEVELGANGQLNYGKMVSSLCYNDERNELIKSIVCSNPERKILILTGLVDHAKLLVKEFQGLNERVDFLAGTKKKYNDSRILIGTFSKIGTGFDEKSACADYNGVRIDLLILASSIKKHGLLEQNVGRVFRADFPTVYHLVDNHPVFKRHWGAVKGWYLSRNGELK